MEAAHGEPAGASRADSAAAAELSEGLAARIADLEADLHLAEAAAAETERRAAAAQSGSANGGVGAGAARGVVLQEALGRAHRLVRPQDVQYMIF